MTRTASITAPTLDMCPIRYLAFDRSCRDELVPILAALKHIYCRPELFSQVTELVGWDLSHDSEGRPVAQDTGRPGLTAWQVFVLASVRLGKDVDYDELQDLTANHKNLRIMLELGEWHVGGFDHRRIGENLSHLQPETIERITRIIAEAGCDASDADPDNFLAHVRVDSFVVKTNTHYPADRLQMGDGVRKLLDIGCAICARTGLTVFRQHRHHRRKLVALQKELGACSRCKQEQEERKRTAYRMFFDHCNYVCDLSMTLIDRVRSAASDGALELGLLEAEWLNRKEDELWYFMSGTAHVAHLAKQRVVDGITVPHDDKLFSLFEPHAELINRGKYPLPYELGHRCYVAENDQGMIVDFGVMENGVQDVEELPRIVKRLQEQAQARGTRLGIVSFDRGFHSPENQEILNGAAEAPCLPKKGTQQGAAQWAESDALFKRARARHAGIESCIAALGHNGLRRCRDRGLRNYHRYVALGMLGRNLITLGRMLIRKRDPECDAATTTRHPPLRHVA